MDHWPLDLKMWITKTIKNNPTFLTRMLEGTHILKKDEIYLYL